MTIQEFNQNHGQYDLLKATCGSHNWVSQMLAAAPYESRDQLIQIGMERWNTCKSEDWLEAFLHHPEIGNIDSLKKKYAQSKNLSEQEQAQVSVANEDTLKSLATQNKKYKDKFGFIFIVFATGKSADEMLELLNQRIDNSREKEIRNAMEEQWKITKLRLENLLT